MAGTDCIEHPPTKTLSRADIERLALKLYAVAVGSISTIGPADRDNLVLASRALRQLVSAFERASGRTLTAILIEGVR